MSKKTILIFLLCLLTSAHLFAEVTTYQPNISESSIDFRADATLHPAKGKTSTIVTEVRFDKSTHKVLLPLTVEIPVHSLDTGLGVRNMSMRQMFHSEQYPLIKWEAQSVECEEVSKTQDVICHAVGNLEIKGVVRETAFDMLLNINEEKILSKGKLSLSLKDYGLKAPSVIGLLKVSDQVDLEIDIKWIKKV